MNKDQRARAVARCIASMNRPNEDPSDFTDEEYEEAHRFVALYDVLRQIDVQSDRV